MSETTTTTYYDVLGIASTASADEIKVAYWRLAQQFHPDKNPGVTDSVRKIAEAKFREIEEAYRLLSDPVKRAQYDQEHASFFGPSAPDPIEIVISPAELVSDLEAYFARYLSVPTGATLLLSLWTMHTHVFQAFESVPYLNVRSATPECGKSTVFKLLAQVCARPRLYVRPSIAIVFHVIDAESPTLLLDQSEFLQAKTDYARELLDMVNEGYVKGAVVARWIDGMESTFNVFCPKAFASVKGLIPGSPEFGRSITIYMKPGDAVYFRKTKEVARTSDLKARLEAYASQNEERLLRIQEESENEKLWPDITRRNRELWEPLLFHARLAGPEIEARAYELAKQFCQDKRNAHLQEPTVALARELVYVLEKNGNGRTKSGRAIDSTSGALVKLVKDGENWGATLSGKGNISRAMFMARFLRNFQIKERPLNGSALFEQPDILAKLRPHISVVP